MNQREIKDRLGYFMFLKDIFESGAYSKLSTPAKVIYPIIGIHINKDGIAYPSLSRLIKLSGLCRQSVVNAINELSNKGFITKIKGNPRDSNKYKIVFEYEGSILNRLQESTSKTRGWSTNLTAEVYKMYQRVVYKFDPNKVIYNKVIQPNKKKQQITTNIIKIDKIQDSQVNLTENGSSGNIFQKIIKELKLKETGKEILKNYIDNYSEDWVNRAFSESVKRAKPSLHYMEGILRKWQEQGRIHQGTFTENQNEKRKETEKQNQLQEQLEKQKIEEAEARKIQAEEILLSLSPQDRRQIKKEAELLLEVEGITKKTPGYNLVLQIKERELALNKYQKVTI